MKNFNYLLNHKFLPVLAIFLLCITVFFTYSFASSDINIYDRYNGLENVTVRLPNGYGSDYNYYVIWSEYTSSLNLYGYYIVVSQNEIFIDDSVGYLQFSGSYLYSLSSAIWSKGSPLTDIDFTTYSLPSDFSLYNNGFSSSSLRGFDNILVSSHPIYSNSDKTDVVFDNTVVVPFTNPYFITTQEELVEGNIDKLVISSGDMNSYNSETFYLQSYYYPKDVSQDESYESLFPVKEIELNGTSNKYFVGANDKTEYVYEIPRADLGIDLTEGNEYAFVLAVKDEDGYYTRLSRLSFTVRSS